MSIALIDGDEIAYKIASSYQERCYGIYKDDKLLWRSRNREDAIESIGNRDDLDIQLLVTSLDTTGYEKRIDEAINAIKKNTNSDSHRVYLSGNSNFRYKIATIQPYKGNRDPSTKPSCYPIIRQELVNRGAEFLDLLEADDLLSAYNEILKTDNPIICSSDKDLKTVPSINYTISSGKIIEIDQDQAMHNFYYQLLVGDDTDFIPHPYQLGEVSAKAILKNLYGNSTFDYYSSIIEPYISFLQATNKEEKYKTKWYDGRDVHDVLWEIGNLLWMHRTLDPDERWDIPKIHCQQYYLDALIG